MPPSAPHSDDRAADAAPLSLVRLGSALRPVLLPALVLGLATAAFVALWVGLLQPPIYAAAAVLLVPGASERGPVQLSLQGYQQLLESDQVVHSAVERLAAAFPDDPPRPRVGEELLSRRIGDNRASPENARLLRVEVRGADPEVTAATAEAWVLAFLDKCEALAGDGVDERVSEIEQKLEQAATEEELLGAERERLGALIEGEYREQVARWDRRLAERRAAQRRRLAAFDAETEEQVAAFLDRHELEVRRLKVAALAEAYRRRMLESGVDALLAADDGPPAEEGPEISADVSIFGGETIEPLDLEPEPSGDLMAIKRKLMTKADKVRRDEMLLETLRRERAAERAALEERLEIELGALRREREQALYAAADEQARELLEVERQLRDNETVLSSLVRRRSNLDIKRGGCDVKVAAAAVRPAAAEPRNTLAKSLIGLFLGAGLGLILGLARSAGGRA